MRKQTKNSAPAQAKGVLFIPTLVKAVLSQKCVAQRNDFLCKQEKACIVLKYKCTEICAYDISDGFISKADVFSLPENTDYKGLVSPAIKQFQSAIIELGYEINGYTE